MAVTQKPGTNIYTVMLILSFLAILTATFVLGTYLATQFESTPPWKVPAGGS
ncbi:MAG: hypothetical protein WD872_21305 [Pirellulaceae bacterium]